MTVGWIRQKLWQYLANNQMTPDSIYTWITGNFQDVHPKTSWGETSFFVNPGLKLPSGAYFATVKEKDGENDKASDLDRPGVFRLNFGPGRPAFTKSFGAAPARPAKGEIIRGDWDFRSLDTLLPHPVYGWMGWMCILNPSAARFTEIEPLLSAAYEKARNTVDKRTGKLQ